MAKMTLDETGRKYLMEIGLEPVGNRAILVEYAPNDNLGDKLAHFFSSEPYILQMCKNELVLILSAFAAVGLMCLIAAALSPVTGEMNLRHPLVGLVSIPVSLLLFIISFMVSVNIHKSKEF